MHQMNQSVSLIVFWYFNTPLIITITMIKRARINLSNKKSVSTSFVSSLQYSSFSSCKQQLLLSTHTIGTIIISQTSQSSHTYCNNKSTLHINTFSSFLFLSILSHHHRIIVNSHNRNEWR